MLDLAISSAQAKLGVLIKLLVAVFFAGDLGNAFKLRALVEQAQLQLARAWNAVATTARTLATAKLSIGTVFNLALVLALAALGAATVLLAV